jgi:hypothetical protein
MEVNGSQWKTMEVNGSQWKSMEVNGSQWKSMEVNGSQWKSMEVNGRPQLQKAVAERKLLYVSLSVSPGIMSQFPNLLCISDRIQDLRVSTGRWEVTSGKWQVSQHV